MKNLLKKTIEYGLYLLVFMLPWQTRWIVRAGDIGGKYFEYGTYSLYASDILLVFLLLLAAIYFFVQKPDLSKIKYKKIWYALALLELSSFVSIFFATDHYIAIYKYLFLLLCLGFFALIIYFPLQSKKILIVFSASIIVQSLLAISQFLVQISPGNKWLGVSEHIPYDAGVSVVEAMGSLGFVERWMRAYGSLDHPNILGGFLSMGLILIIFFFLKKLHQTHQDGSGDYRRQIFLLNMMLYPTVLVSGVAILFSFSRSAWIAFFMSLLLLLFFITIKKEKLKQKYLLPIILYSGIIVFILYTPFSNLIDARINGQGRIEYISTKERLASADQAKMILKDNWLWGVGIGNYTMAVREKYVKDENVFFYQPTHNTFLLIWSELGAFGFLGFFLFFIFLYFYGFRQVEIAYKLPFLVSFFILLFFDHFWWSLHFGLLYFFLISGLSLHVIGLDNDRENML